MLFALSRGDYLILLSIGGAPEDPKNLWSQPRNGECNAKKKDELGFKLYKLVCDGRVPLAEALHEMAKDWIVAYKKYVR